MLDFLKFFGTNEIILGVCSLLGIAGFIMTLIVTIKTTKIAKIFIENNFDFNCLSSFDYADFIDNFVPQIVENQIDLEYQQKLLPTDCKYYHS